jgi:tRNA modification GTPase
MGGIGIVRISGPLAREIGEAVAGGPLHHRRARYAHFRDAAGEPVDTGICLCFAGPNSFTGEDVIELQGHGGPVVMRLVLDAVLARGARMARPGEFTERAFLNGKLDLAQAEAVADLIGSASASAAKGALRSLEGAFSAAVTDIDAAVLGLRVFVEAAMDFPDEAIEFLAEGQVAARLEAVREKIAKLLEETRQGVLLRDGVVVALVGAPNVGKSSLLNRLSGQDRAIVSDIPGTTRDPVEADLVLDGLPIRVVDTAGLRQSADPIEREGVRRTTLHAMRADLVLALEEDAHAVPWTQSGLRALLLETLPEVGHERVIRILNKVDLSANAPGTCTPAVDAAVRPLAEPATVRVSATTGAGIPALVELIEAHAGYAAHEGSFTARRRHVEALRGAGAAIDEAVRLLADHAAPEIVAEELRGAHRFLGGIVGTVSADELLGEIFATFCIGK